MSELENPVTRIEKYLFMLATDEEGETLPVPVTRVEKYLAAMCEGSGKFDTKTMTVTYDDETTESFDVVVIADD